MGEKVEVEEDVLRIGRHWRVRVILDVTKSLHRYRKIEDNKGKESQIDFAYERLHFFVLPVE